MKYQEWQELRRMQQTIEKRLRIVFYVLLFGLIFSLLAIKFAPAQKIASTNATGPAGSMIGRNFPINWLYLPVNDQGYLMVAGIGGGGGGGSTNPYADLYPAACGVAGAPAYCSGTTPDAWIRSACAALPSTGGFISLRGLTGNIVNSVTCSTPTKQVIMYADNTSHLAITESDGGIAFPLDNGSMFIGQGAGQCVFNTGGIHLAGTANVTAIVGPAHTDGSQENFTAEGLCLAGATGATVSQGLIYTESNFANTTIDNNNIFVTNTAGIKVINSSSMEIANNWINGTDGASVTNSPLVIESSGTGGCGAGTITVIDGQIEHAFGGGPEIDIHGDGAGALVCNVHVIGVGLERNTTSASTIGVKISDCWNCSVDHINASGTTGGTDLVNISQTAAGRTKNVNVTNLYASATYTNAINDSTPGGSVLTSSANPQITTYYAQVGYLSPGNGITGITGDGTATGPGMATLTVSAINGVDINGLGAGPLRTDAGHLSIAQSMAVPTFLQAGTYSRSGVNTIATCSGSVTFDLSLGDYQQCNLTGNVTSSAVANAPSGISALGQTIHFQICQAASGSPFSFAWPTAFNGVTPVTTTIGTCTTESFTIQGGNIQSDAYNSALCISAASPAVCGQAVQGDVAIPTGTNPTLTINTTGYVAASQLVFTPDSTLGAALSVTCNTANLPTGWEVTAATPGTSVTLTLTGTFSTNPVCGKFTIRNL